MVHAFQLLFKNDCNFPIAFSYFIGAHALMFYFLFSGFYKSTYTAKDRKQKVKANDDQGQALQQQEKQSNGYVQKKQTCEENGIRQRGPFAGANGWICQPVHIN